MLLIMTKIRASMTGNYGEILDPELHLDAEKLNLSGQQTLPEFDDI